ncbi:Na(+)/H(+) antiporter subunit C [Dietzia psychralcaliphila]|uniref:Cation:proton antiporter n=1 Tax=Dietzia psychralcaliphila TaxID=139021 RepID=A0AAD0JVK1_9ACTN|nr:Na(+)/H(+) antiporter subunit C [Dietzia psychralcaliphila]AWH96516.1 cation:proton antiporter [Dietzia psychralcaliphila]PTM90319.1 multisubunit sodium/proton antiporter MrpC subunit [Dietzia psychralcaliphila]
MTADFGLLMLAGLLCATGVYLLLERAIIKILLGIMIFSNGINLLLLAAGGPPGSPPIMGRGRSPDAADSDPLSHGMILTAIVITAGVGAFILALAYRSYQFTTVDEVADDAEDTKIAKRSPADAWSAPDRDLSDDHTTGQPTELGDHVDYDDEDLEEAEAEAEAEARARAVAKARSRRQDKNPDDDKEGGR